MFLRLFATYLLFVIVSDALLGWVFFQHADVQRSSTLYRDFFIATTLSAILAMVPAYYLARRLVQPLQELTEGAHRIAGGDYGHRIYVNGVGESQSLARAFNEMSEELATQFRQLETDHEQLRTILSGMVEGVVAIDDDQRMLFANERAADLLDFPLDEAKGRKFWEVVRHRQIQQVMERARNTQEAHREEIDWVGPGVKSMAIYVAKLPGIPSRGTIMVLHDTTKLRQLERLRQDFVANVTHELNTPLSVIKACVEALFDGAMDDPEARWQFLEQVAEQSDRLHALILDLLSLARIESGNLAMQITAVPISYPIQEAVERHRMRAEAKNQRLIMQPPAQDDLEAWLDEEAIAQILDNLIDNAVKYTPERGSIRVRWFSPDANHVALEVADSGMGIPENELPRIFERFYRVDKGRSRQIPGTGLGLAIVKHLVQALQGNIKATSRLGVGTTFTVSLPRVRDQ